MYHPEEEFTIINIGTMGNILFFFMSGMFFKPDTWNNFVHKKTIQLLVPFIIFYILSFPLDLIIHYWDHRELGTYPWERILHIFDIDSGHSYLRLNIPLWFLLALFVIQLISQMTFKMGKGFVITTIFLSFALNNTLSEWPTIFMINNATVWYGYFALGWLTKNRLLNAVSPRRGKLLLGLTSMLVFVILTPILRIQGINDWLHTELIIMQHISFILLTVVVFCSIEQQIKKLRISPVLTYMGQNTLALLCLHVYIMYPFYRLAYKVCVGIEEPSVLYILGVTLTIMTIFL